EVIKIESRVKPDMLRFWAGEDDSPLFHFSNRSKYGVDLNLKDPAGRSAFLALVATADVVIENYRRGVLERLDLDFDVLREANPTVTLASISGQGLDGPLAGHTTFGSTLEATSGFSALTTDEAGRPMISGANLNYPDQTVCLFAAAVIVAAVTTVRRTGAATHLDVSQRDVAIYACGPVLEQLARGGAPATWPARLDASGGWVAEGADGTEQPVLTGPQLLEACRAEASTAVIDAPYGGLTKGFPFRFSSRTMTISGPAPAIGQDDDRYLIPRPNSREHA
ncbi:MAG: CoA transferase, partial [Actinomycetota bacterium]